jgi:hypothetical protein
MSRPGNMSIKSGDGLKPGQLKKKQKKPTSSVSNGLWFLMSQWARNSQSGLVALAVIYYALCKSTSKSAQPVLYSKWSVQVNGFVQISHGFECLPATVQT